MKAAADTGCPALFTNLKSWSGYKLIIISDIQSQYMTKWQRHTQAKGLGLNGFLWCFTLNKFYFSLAHLSSGTEEKSEEVDGDSWPVGEKFNQRLHFTLISANVRGSGNKKCIMWLDGLIKTQF